MKILSVSGCPCEDYDGQILHLYTKLDEGEEIRLNDIISIEMMDDTFIKREVLLINSDYYNISENVRKKIESGEYGKSDNPTMNIKGSCSANIVVKDVPYHEVKTDEEIARRKFLEEQKKMKCLSPFKELHFGDKSIYRSERFMASHLYYCINPLS